MGLWAQNSKQTTEDLVAILKQIEAATPGAAARNPRLGLKNTIKFLEKQAQGDVEALIKHLSMQKQKAPPARRSPPKVRADVVQRHNQALEAAGENAAMFETAVEALKSDKQVRLIELKEIVASYTGTKQSVSSKPKGYGMIEQSFDRRWKLANR